MNGNDEEQKQVTFSIELYFSNIMRMLHPFMPFVTEKMAKFTT